jgi:hypothetical protein
MGEGGFGRWFMDGGHVWVGLAIIFASTGIHVVIVRSRTWRLAAELLLMYSMGVSGFKAVFGGFVMHYFYADAMARSIGWAAGSPFQTEVAFFNLAIGVLGALTFLRKDFWFPFIIVSTIMGWGAASVHLAEAFMNGNSYGNNAGPILYADLFLPVLRIALYVIYRRGTGLRGGTMGDPRTRRPSPA